MSEQPKDPVAAPAKRVKATQKRDQDPVTPVPAKAKATSTKRIKLPPGLPEEAAKIIYEFWARYDADKRKGQFVPWERVPPPFQRMWVQITQLILEMAVTVILSDANRFLENSNGDMGVAFGKALRRYASEILELTISDD